MNQFNLAVASDTLRRYTVSLNQADSLFEQVFSHTVLQPQSLCWSPKFDSLAVSVERDIHVYDIKGQLIDCLSNCNTLSNENELIQTIAFGYRSSRFIYYAGASKVIKIWDRQDRKISVLLTGHKSTIQTLALTTDDQRMVSGSDTGQIIVNSLKHGTRSPLISPFKQSVNAVAFYPFKKSIIMGAGDDGSIGLWDIHQSKLDPYQLKKSIHLGPITDVAFAPCNKHLYCSVGLDKVLRFHDIQQGSKGLLYSFTNSEPLTCVSINDDHSVAVGTNSGAVHVYDVRWKGIVLSIPSTTDVGVKDLAFQPPKWVIENASKEKSLPSGFSVSTTCVLDENKPKQVLSETKLEAQEKETAKENNNKMMDMFSPVNSNKIKTIPTTTDLRKVVLFKNMIKQVENKPGEEEEEEIPEEFNASNPEEIQEEGNQIKAEIDISDSIKNELPLPTPIKAWTSQKQESSFPLNTSQKTHSSIGGLATTMEDQDRIQKNAKELANKILKSSSSTSSNNGISSFQYHVLENIIQDSLSDFCIQIRLDIQNMHLELLRQFELQKADIVDLFQQHMPNDVLLEEIARLREENTRLKLHHG